MYIHTYAHIKTLILLIIRYILKFIINALPRNKIKNI